MKVTIDNTTGLMIESQSDRASDEAMLTNAAAVGFNDVSIRIVDDTDHAALIAARDASRIASDPSLSAEKVRADRDKLLSDSDWTQVADAPVNQAAWAAYRQKLRDITLQAGFPLAVTWPVAP